MVRGCHERGFTGIYILCIWNSFARRRKQTTIPAGLVPALYLHGVLHLRNLLY